MRRTKKQRAEAAYTEAERCLGNANEELAAKHPKAAAQWEARAQKWLDRANDLSGNGEGRADPNTCNKQ